jgi:hypothetical protein
MPYSFIRRATADSYPLDNSYTGTLITGLPPTEKVNVSVESNPVIMQLSTNRGFWGNEIMLRPGIHNRTEKGVIGVRFRSASVGISALVSIELS